MSKNLLWGEKAKVRTPHSTTTLIRSGKRTILVDPGLPAAVLSARLYERSGLKAEAVDTIFLTSFRPAHRAGLAAFARARVLICERERETVRPYLEKMLEAMGDERDEQRTLVANELAILNACEIAEDKIAAGVDLFPLPGFSEGTCGLLLTTSSLTVLVAGDGVPTQEHFLAGQVLPESQDIAQAQESMREVYEIADLVIPGHDNIFINPRMQGM